MRDREEQIRNGMSLGEEQQLYWNKEDYLNEEEIPIELYVKRNGETIKFVRFEEIERLNNIINELEKWLEEQHQFIIEIPAYTKEISIEHKTMEICYENVLDKLQELKGSDNRE